VAGHVARETHPWDLNLSAVGAFPQLQHPQTIFVGTGQGAGHLTLLADKLTKALEQCDLLSGDQKPFVAHCTLGRCKQERGLGGLVAALEAEAEFQAGPMSCHEFALLASELTQAGPKYTEIASFTFSPRPEAPA
jgi:2'-5' RNA ligase